MTTLEKIIVNLRDRMSGYTDSRQPTDDEVRIAWLVSEVVELNEQLEKYTTKERSYIMNTIQSITVNNNSAVSVRRVNVEKLVYKPSHVQNGENVSEQCIITTQQEEFSAWGEAAEACITHLVKGESLCCTYTSKNGKLGTVQINGCNSTRVLSEVYKWV